MLLDASDLRPKSLLERQPLDPQQLAGGGTLASGIPFTFALFYLFYVAAEAVGLVPPPIESEPPPVESPSEVPMHHWPALRNSVWPLIGQPRAMPYRTY